MNALGYAIKMEKEGNQYYLNQAEISNNKGLKNVFLMLAKDEKNHEMILRNKMIETPYTLIPSDVRSEAENVFYDLGNFKSDIKDIPRQLELYRMALDKENQSIDLYTDMLSKASEADERTLFEYLIKQEEQHYEILDNLVMSLSRPEEWVESAEFGIMTTRGEY